MRLISLQAVALLISLLWATSSAAISPCGNLVQCVDLDTAITEINAEINKNKQNAPGLKRLIGQINTLKSVSQKLQTQANLPNPTVIALAKVSNAFSSEVGEPIAITVQLLSEIGDDPDMLAAVVAHEFGHVIKNHTTRKKDMTAIASRRVYLSAKRTYASTANIDLAKRTFQKEQVNQKINLSAFSRAAEFEADDVAIQLISKTGFDVQGFKRVAIFLKEKSGDGGEDIFATHPGWLDRLDAIEPRIDDESYDKRASAAIKSKSWNQLRLVVNQWLERLPQSGNAWFYHGAITQNLNRIDYVQSFEKAFIAAKPKLGEFDKNFNSAWLSLCLGLHAEGYVFESMQCARRLPSEELQERFKKAISKGLVLWGGNDTGDLSLYFSRGHPLAGSRQVVNLSPRIACH